MSAVEIGVMPEGDTIHKLAAALAPKFGGQLPRRVAIKDRDGGMLTGQRIEAVYARGKHLFVAFENGVLLRSHLGMHGSWHRYALTERWKKPAWQASVVLEIGSEVFVCFNAKEIELLRAAGVRHRSLTARLSLDLLAPDPDLAMIPERAREFLSEDTQISDVLLDQRIACGIGNVYKSEVLFLHGIHPLARLGAVGDEELIGVYRTARELLRKNLESGPRVTRSQGDATGCLWVYGRKGLLCFRCGATIRYARLGEDWRSTYWCAVCQPVPSAAIPGN